MLYNETCHNTENNKTRRLAMNEEINNRVRNIYDKLRPFGLSPGEYLELFSWIIFICHSDRSILDKLKTAGKEYLLQEIVQQGQKNNLSALLDQDILKKVSSQALLQIYLIVEELSPNDDFEFLNTLFKTINSNLGKDGSNRDKFSSSSKLALDLLQPQPDQKIYDPCFGVGTTFESVLTKNPQQEIFGQTANHASYVIATVLAYLRQAVNVSLRNEDVLNTEMPKEVIQQMDLVVSCPPMNARRKVDLIDQQRYEFGQPSQMNDWAYIMSGLYALNQQGKAAFITTNSLIYRGGKDAEVRKQVIAKDLVEAVISLPDEPDAPTSVPLVLLVFNLNKKRHQQQVVFVNARHLKQENADLSQQISEIIANGSVIDGVSALISNQEIEQNNGVLIPDQYITQNVFKIDDDLTIKINRSEWEKSAKYVLGDVAEFYRGFNTTRKDESEAGKYSLLKISDLNGAEVNFSKLAKTDGQANTKVDSYQIQKGDVLLPIRGEIKHIGVVKEEHPNVLLTQNMIGIRPNTDLINSEWLAEYLNSPLGRAQLSGISVGTRIKQIPIKMLKEMEIIKLPKEVQDEAIDKYDQEMEKLREQLLEIRRAMNRQQNSLYDDSKIATLYRKV